MTCPHTPTPENTYTLDDGVRRCRSCISDVLCKMQERKGLDPNPDLLLYPHKLMTRPQNAPLKTHCVNGHSLEDALTAVRKSAATKGRYHPARAVKLRRLCRVCTTERNKLRDRSKRATVKNRRRKC